MNDFRHKILPYLLEPVGQDEWLFLNRDYKPLGQISNWHVDYEKCPTFIIPRVSVRKLHGIGLRTSKLEPEVTDQIQLRQSWYLYNDPTAPDRDKANWDRYTKILLKLLKMKLDQPR